MYVYRYDEEEPIFNETEEEIDMLDDCDVEIDEFSQEKADKNLKQYHFRFVPESEGIGE